MPEALIVNKQPLKDLLIPDDFKLVRREAHKRNGEKVTVLRYQKNDEIVPNNEHVTVIVGADERLISYNRFSIDRAILKLPTSGNEVALAERIWDEVDPDYAAGLARARDRS